jgi:hypothetical protein
VTTLIESLRNLKQKQRSPSLKNRWFGIWTHFVGKDSGSGNISVSIKAFSYIKTTVPNFWSVFVAGAETRRLQAIREEMETILHLHLGTSFATNSVHCMTSFLRCTDITCLFNGSEV